MISFSLVYIEQAAIYMKTNVNTILVIKAFGGMLEHHAKEPENRWNPVSPHL